MKSTWTAFCAMPSDKRGVYSEEIDVEADSPIHARQAAEIIIKKDYMPGLKVRRVVRRPPGLFF